MNELVNPPIAPPPLAIFVLSYNGRDILERCLPSLAGQGHLVVVDNGSEDDTAEYLKQRWPEATIFRLQRNGGLGAALNAAVKAVPARNIVLMNNDVIVLDNALRRLCALLDDDASIGIAAPKLMNADGSVQEFGNDIGLMGLPAIPRRVELPQFETLFQSGCVTAVRRDQFLALGGYAEIFEWFYEDLDLAWNFRNAGLRTVVDDRCRCIHLLGATLGNAARENPELVGRSDARRRRRTYYASRNVLLMFCLRAPWYQMALQIPFIMLRQIAEAAAASMAGDREMAATYPRAWRDALRLLPAALHQSSSSHRRRVHTLRFVQFELLKMLRRVYDLARGIYRERRARG
jgi:GT2 family glycosyltransferase